MDDLFDRAEHAQPGLREVIRQIREVRREAFSRPYEEFFEGKSVFDLSGTAPRLIGLSLSDVETWAKHVAYSTRVRMLSLEPTIVSAIGQDSLTPAMVLLRGHCETAGLATLALLTLREGNEQKVRDIIQRTMFGSALANGWKPFGDLHELIPYSEAQPPLARQLMDALDDFVAAGAKGNGRYRAAYGLLCEFAHPNSRGMLGFVRSAEVPPLGWRIRYSPTETVDANGPAMVLTWLLEFMRLGYSASEFLRLGRVSEVAGGFTIAPPAPAATKRVLTKLMLLQEEPDSIV